LSGLIPRSEFNFSFHFYAALLHSHGIHMLKN
jgi:hypothetical protein